MKVEVGRGENPRDHGNSRGCWRSVMQTEAGGGGRRGDWNPDGCGGATGAACVVPVMARCVTRLYSRARECSIQLSTSEWRVGLGNREGGVQ